MGRTKLELPKGYRRLKVGEIVLLGDIYFDSREGKWLPMNEPIDLNKPLGLYYAPHARKNEDH